VDDAERRDSHNRDSYNGFGDGMNRAVEFAVTPVLFGGLGFALDRSIGMVPVFTITLMLFAMVGLFVRMWFTYDLEMRRHEEQGTWAKRS
jgi:F0F1-type ATP synthase assembly protein I